MYTTDQIVSGIINYADNEVMKMLPTSGKWLVGAGLGLATSRVKEIADKLSENSLIKLLGVVDEKGCWDVDAVMSELCESASKYGKAHMQIPFVGDLAFSSDDMKILKEYIEKEA